MTYWRLKLAGILFSTNFNPPFSKKVKYMKSKFFLFLLLSIGCVSFMAGSYKLYSLYDKANKMEHTVGTIIHLKQEVTYRHRKRYYKNTAHIQYKTKLYDTHVSMQLHNPFLFQGSEIALWYNPDRTEEVVIPSEEGIVWGSTWIFGALCLFLGIVIIKTQK